MVTLLVPLPRLVSQPKVIPDHQPQQNQRDADHQDHTSTFLLSALRGGRGGAFGTSGRCPG